MKDTNILFSLCSENNEPLDSPALSSILSCHRFRRKLKRLKLSIHSFASGRASAEFSAKGKKLEYHVKAVLTVYPD